MPTKSKPPKKSPTPLPPPQPHPPTPPSQFPTFTDHTGAHFLLSKILPTGHLFTCSHHPSGCRASILNPHSSHPAYFTQPLHCHLKSLVPVIYKPEPAKQAQAPKKKRRKRKAKKQKRKLKKSTDLSAKCLELMKTPFFQMVCGMGMVLLEEDDSDYEQGENGTLVRFVRDYESKFDAKLDEMGVEVKGKGEEEGKEEIKKQKRKGKEEKKKQKTENKEETKKQKKKAKKEKKNDQNDDIQPHHNI